MRRVVVTGIGIVSGIGNDRNEVLNSLREGRSGVEFSPEYAELDSVRRCMRLCVLIPKP